MRMKSDNSLFTGFDGAEFQTEPVEDGSTVTEESLVLMRASCSVSFVLWSVKISCI